MIENFSTHAEMFCTGGRAGRGGWPGIGGGRLFKEISNISTYSRSKIFFSSLGGRTALGLHKPPLLRVDVLGDLVEVVEICVVPYPQQPSMAGSSSRETTPPDTVKMGRVDGRVKH